MISSQTKKTKKNTPTLPQPFPQRLPWEKRLAWPMPRCYHLELLVKHLLPPVTSVTPWRSKNHQRYHEIIGDPPQPKFALLTFNFFFFGLGCSCFSIRGSSHAGFQRLQPDAPLPAGARSCAPKEFTSFQLPEVGGHKNQGNIANLPENSQKRKTRTLKRKAQGFSKS